MKRAILPILCAILLNFNLFLHSDDNWTPSAPIASPHVVIFEASDNVYTVSHCQTHEIFAAWQDSLTGYPTFSIYNRRSGWSTPSFITTDSTAHPDVYLAFDNQTNEIFAAWGDPKNNGRPTYSIYQHETGWTHPSPITEDSSAYSNVYLAYNCRSKQLFACLLYTSPSPRD